MPQSVVRMRVRFRQAPRTFPAIPDVWETKGSHICNQRPRLALSESTERWPNWSYSVSTISCHPVLKERTQEARSCVSLLPLGASGEARVQSSLLPHAKRCVRTALRGQEEADGLHRGQVGIVSRPNCSGCRGQQAQRGALGTASGRILGRL
jgi:hypothetical protein